MFTRSLLMSAVAVPALLAGAAQAQSSAPQAPQALQAEANADDIVVTAQKHSERLSDVGLSITAATGAQLTDRGVTDIQSLTRIEPSLQFATSASGSPVYTLRGVGYFEQSLSATPTVSLYQDEVPYAYPVMSQGALLDVERVEVLKGPQGTFYGQNATGGAVNFIANKPGSHLEAGVEGSLARFGAVHAEGYISGPLTDTLGMRLSAETYQGGAWQRSNTRNADLGDRNYIAGRLLTVWEPSDRFKATLNLNGWVDKSETQASQLIGIVLLSPQNFPPLTSTDRIPRASDVAAGVFPADLAAVITNPLSPHNNRAADWVPGTRPHKDQDFEQASLRLDFELTDSIGITSLSSYEHFRMDDFVDPSGVNTASTNFQPRGKVNSVFQELRLHGDFAGGGNWMIGANYAHDKSTEIQYQDTLLSASYLSTTGIPWRNLSTINNNTTETKSIYANIAIPLFDTLKLNGGIRYTKSNADLSGCSSSTDRGLSDLVSGGQVAPGQCYTLDANFVSGLVRNTLNEHNVPWRVGLDWKATPGTLVYATVSQGYKAGSAPTTASTSYQQLIPATQESLRSYELGLKTSLLNRTVSLNLAAFYYDYKDKQLLGRIIDPIFGPIFALLNVPKSREIGFEGSVILHPVDGLTLDGAVTYLDSKVKSDFSNFNAYGFPINFKNEPFPFTPKWSGSVGARYEFETADLRPYVSTRLSFQSRTQSSFGGASIAVPGYPSLYNKGYALLDLAVGVKAADGRWHAEIWGRNVTNTYYWNTAAYNIDTVVRRTGMPATFGITAGFSFK